MAWAALKRNASRFVQAFNTETRIACRSWTIHWLGWCWPLLLFGVISGVYQAGTLLDMPLAVIDKDHSQLSRKLIRELDATSHAQVITVPAGVQEGLDAIRRADAYALLYIPPDFEADVLGGRAPKAELYYNGEAARRVGQRQVTVGEDLGLQLLQAQLRSLVEHPAQQLAGDFHRRNPAAHAPGIQFGQGMTVVEVQRRTADKGHAALAEVIDGGHVVGLDPEFAVLA